MEQVEDRNRELTTNELDHVSGGLKTPPSVKRLKMHCHNDLSAPLHNFVRTGNHREIPVLFGTSGEDEYVCTNCGCKIWK